MWHLDKCYVPGGLHNHLTHSTTNDKDLKLQSPAAKEYEHVTQSWTAQLHNMETVTVRLAEAVQKGHVRLN